MTASDMLRAIELLNRAQHCDVLQLMQNPEDQLARQHFRERAAVIRSLRLQLSTRKEKPAAESTAG